MSMRNGLLTLAAMSLVACSSPGRGGGQFFVDTFDATSQDGGGDGTGDVSVDGEEDGADVADEVSEVIGDTPVTDTEPDQVTPDVVPDETTTPDAEVDTGPVWEETTIQALQSGSNVAGCDPALIADIGPVLISDVIVSSPKYDAYTPSSGTGGLDGYYVTDGTTAAFSGLVITIDRALGTDFAPGTVLNVAGVAAEYYCLTELPVSEHVVVSTGGAAPNPINVAAASAGQEQYEGMLLKINNVTIDSEIAGGTYQTASGLIIDHQFDFFLSMQVGASYNVTGQLTYTFGEYRLMPRSTDDVELIGGGGDQPNTTIFEIQDSAASTGCSLDNQLQTIEPGLVLDATVVAGPWDISGSLTGYAIVEGPNAEQGLTLAVPNTLGVDLLPGQTIRVAGTHIEAYCNTQLTATDVTVLSSGAVPDPHVFVAPPAGWEAWEGSLVTLSNVSVTGTTDFDEAETNAGVLIDDELASGAIVLPVAGETVTVTGVVRYGFSNYRISPRNQADIQVAP